MNIHADKTQENKSQAVANSLTTYKSSNPTFHFVDNRPEAVVQRKLQEMANNHRQVLQLQKKPVNDPNNLNDLGVLQLKEIVQRKEEDALKLARGLHPTEKDFASIVELLESKLDFSKESWEEIVAAYNRGLGEGQPRLRAVYPKLEPKAATTAHSIEGRITGFGSDGETFRPTTLQKVGEKLQSAIHSAIHHAPDLASTGFELATHTVDPKALHTATSEFITALKESGADLGDSDYRSFAVHLADAAAGAIRSGASIASVTHTISSSLEMMGVGIPGIGLLVKLTGDGMWYSAEYFKKEIHKVMDPEIYKSLEHKKRINKLD